MALTIALDPIKIPRMYLPGVYYRFCEIPIVAAFLLFGPKIGVSVAVLNVLAELTIFYGPTGVIGPPTVFVLTLSMLLGVHSARKLLTLEASRNVNLGLKPVACFTAFGALSRTAIAPLVMYPTYRFLIPLVVDLGFSDAQVVALVPAFMSVALIFSLYTIPVGYLIASVVGRNLKVGNQV